MPLSSRPVVRKVEVSGYDLMDLIFNRLMPACSGHKLDHAVLAMLTLSALMMRPNVSTEKLQEAVLRTSEALIMNLTDEPGEDAN